MNPRYPITPEEIEAELRDMHAALPRFQWAEGAVPQLTRVYREALESFDREAVHGGATLGRKTWEKFPSPAQWRERTETWLVHNRLPVERKPEFGLDGRDIVCRTCRSTARWAVLAMRETPFSIPQRPPAPGEHALPGQAIYREPRLGLAAGEVLRMIAVCDPSRHHDARQPQTLPPENFLRWAE